MPPGRKNSASRAVTRIQRVLFFKLRNRAGVKVKCRIVRARASSLIIFFSFVRKNSTPTFRRNQVFGDASRSRRLLYKSFRQPQAEGNAKIDWHFRFAKAVCANFPSIAGATTEIFFVRQMLSKRLPVFGCNAFGFFRRIFFVLPFRHSRNRQFSKHTARRFL